MDTNQFPPIDYIRILEERLERINFLEKTNSIEFFYSDEKSQSWQEIEKEKDRFKVSKECLHQKFNYRADHLGR